MLFCGIDLHSNNCLVVVSDDNDKVVYSKQLPNDLAVICDALSPYQRELFGVVVESTYNWYWLVDGLAAAGYSRMESTPILREKRGMDMPVRLNLFPPVKQNDSTRYPVYVVQQGNEAIYVRLKEELVLEWLHSLGCSDMFNLNPGGKIGAGLLGSAQPMSPFLDNLPETAIPPVYFYNYTLLHSYSHLLMKHVSEYSGLDLGSLGEYIFPADLAFVVYRNGTTMDLGNLSPISRPKSSAYRRRRCLQCFISKP